MEHGHNRNRHSIAMQSIFKMHEMPLRSNFTYEHEQLASVLQNYVLVLGN